MWNKTFESITNDVITEMFVVPASSAASVIFSTRVRAVVAPFYGDTSVDDNPNPLPADRRLSGATC